MSPPERIELDKFRVFGKAVLDHERNAGPRRFLLEPPVRYLRHRLGRMDVAPYGQPTSLPAGSANLKSAASAVLAVTRINDHGRYDRRGRAGQRPTCGACRHNRLKSIEASHRREFVPRDQPISTPRIATGGACHDGRRSNQRLLAAGAEGYERRAISGVRSREADGRHVRDAARTEVENKGGSKDPPLRTGRARHGT